MTNKQKYDQCFRKTFETELFETLEYKNHPLWNSIGHIALVSAIEEAFDVLLEPEDMMALTSYKQGQNILSKHYQIEF